MNPDDPKGHGFVCKDNLTYHRSYGLNSSFGRGTAALNGHFESCWQFSGNVLAGGTASQYPSNNFFPTEEEFEAEFESFGVLREDSQFAGKGCDWSKLPNYPIE